MAKLYSFIATIILGTFCIILCTSCQKKFNCEDCTLIDTTGNTAIYTFKGAPNNCTGSFTNGNYFVGIPLGSGNTIQLVLNVTTPGAYSITTSTINGTRFFASGTFTSIGEQSITLSGQGTPASTGTFNYKPITSDGCIFSIKVNSAPPAIATFTLAGDPGICTNAKFVGNYISGKALDNTNKVTISVNVTSIGNYSIQTDTLDGINFAASGKFTQTGIQNLTLAGFGTPDFARDLTFKLKGDTSTCTLDITVINPEPVATYVLESGFGNPNPCTYTLQGVFATAVPLSNSNTVSMRVYVTVIGNFTIATNTLNGMIFSYSGTFTQLGSQIVILYGTGTPIAPGNNTFIPQIIGPHPLGGQSCAFDINVQ
ncbi:MAG TPA: hypothetical protein VIL78_14880 [Hanamia sp.]